ncbi:MAG: hypothetical protein GY711_25445 [bacterium]|nr:hypothetical protein [bacterium]
MSFTRFLKRATLCGATAGVLYAPAHGQDYWVHFEKQTPACLPSRYVLPALEADVDGQGYGDAPIDTTCSAQKTNPDHVVVTLTTEEDEDGGDPKAAAPGDFVEISFDYRVHLSINPTGANSDQDCDFEVYILPTGSEEPTKVSATTFSIDIPKDATIDAQERRIELIFLSNGGNDLEGIESVVIEITGVDIIGTPDSPPDLDVGINNRATWLLRDNSNPEPPAWAGDDCEDAKPIDGTGVFLFDTTLSTTASALAGPCADGTADVWFEWTAPFNGSFFFDTYDSRHATLVDIYSDSCATPVHEACDNGSLIKLFGSGAELTGVAFGDTYYVRVSAIGSETGFGLLTVSHERPTLAPYVMFTHTTRATREADAQITTKVAQEQDLPASANDDYFGLRFKDIDRSTSGFVEGVSISAGVDCELEFVVDPDAGASFVFSPVTWSGGAWPASSDFTIDITSGSMGVALLAEFGDASAAGVTHDVDVNLVGTVLVGSGALPTVGWNSAARWLVIN